MASLWLGGCAAPALRRADSQARCRQPDAAHLLQSARASLVLVPYRPGPVYDVDASQRAVPVVLGGLAADALAVVSYPQPDKFAGADKEFQRIAGRSFLYDNALAVLWLSHDGDLVRARRLLATVAALQRPDGAWGFSVQTGAQDAFYNAAYVRTGTVAWLLYALAHYRIQSRDPQFDAVAERGLRWLLAQRIPDRGLLRAGQGRWRDAAHFDPDWRADFVATEHQVDAWFALRAAQRAWPDLAVRLGLGAAAGQLAIHLPQTLRLPEGRYAQGWRDGRLDRESALDASGTWTALWELAQHRSDGARELLLWVTSRHGLDVHGWPGLRPYLDAGPPTWFVEGSVARALAWHRLRDRARTATAWRSLLELACAGGLPLVYAPDWQPDFPLTPAAAPTLWLLLAGQEITEAATPWFWAEAP